MAFISLKSRAIGIFAMAVFCAGQVAGVIPASADGLVDAGQFEEPTAGAQLDLTQARTFLVSLINKDRQSQGLQPVVFDDVASRAGQTHTDEMAQVGYLSHWDLRGRKPDQRYSDAGGSDMDMENAYLLMGGGDGERPDHPSKLPLVGNPTFAKADLEKIESTLFNEQPPMDGHRKNILNPEHNRVGIALSVSGSYDRGRLACTEEFINSYGEYLPIPSSIKRGGEVKVAGTLRGGVHLFGIDLMREDLPRPMSVETLNQTYAYGAPTERVASYWPGATDNPGAIDVKPVADGEQFSTVVTTAKSWPMGLYYIWIWAKRGEAAEPFLVSTRTVVVN